MQKEVLPYLKALQQSVKIKISDHLRNQDVKKIARAVFAFHFEDSNSLAFQKYYREMIANRELFLSASDYFRVFKQKYALQGIDNAYLDNLEGEKTAILHYIENGDLAGLYLNFFAKAPIKHGEDIVEKNLGSFFAKLSHTFIPDKYCALDNPIKTYFGLARESFYVAFLIISNAYGEWVSENSELLQQIRAELELNKTGKSFSAKMSDLKLLDMIFWYQANVVTKKRPSSKEG